MQRLAGGLSVFSFSVLMASSVWANGCPELGVAPRTITSPAANYAVSGKFGLDENGILFHDYGRAYDNLGEYHNPYFIGNYAAALYRDYLDTECNDQTLKEKFLLQSTWLMKEGVKRGDLLVWAYNFPNERFDLQAGWISGIGQGRIAGVLERAFALTGDRGFHDAAEAAMRAYETPLTEGGVATIDGDVTWIEEAPHPSGRSFKVLNGHITALGGLQDFYDITGEAKWKELFDRGVRAVERDIAKFDAGFSSEYSLDIAKGRTVVSPRGYNALHVEQLLWLYDQKPNPLFLDWAARFRAYQVTGNTYTAKRSVNAERHGPDQAAAQYGSAYWSDSRFPTWLRIDMPEAEEIERFQLDSNGLKPTPKEFTLSAKIDGQWRILYETKDNTAEALTIPFERSVKATAFRLDIASDNGNKNTAIQAAIPVRAKPPRSSISNACNWRTGNMELAEDGSTETGMKIHCAGFVIVPMEGMTRLSILATGDKGAELTVETSDNLETWADKSVFVVSEGRAAKDISAAWARISFGTDVTYINEISTLQ